MSRQTRATTVVSQPPGLSMSSGFARLTRIHDSCRASSASLTDPSIRQATARRWVRWASNCSARYSRSSTGRLVESLLVQPEAEAITDVVALEQLPALERRVGRTDGVVGSFTFPSFSLPHAATRSGSGSMAAIPWPVFASGCSPRVLVIRRATTAAATRKRLLASSARWKPDGERLGGRRVRAPAGRWCGRWRSRRRSRARARRRPAARS